MSRVVVWIVNPDERVIEVYTPDQTATTLGLDAILTGSSIMPGFALDMRKVFGIQANQE